MEKCGVIDVFIVCSWNGYDNRIVHSRVLCLCCRFISVALCLFFMVRKQTQCRNDGVSAQQKNHHLVQRDTLGAVLGPRSGNEFRRVSRRAGNGC